MPTYTVPGMKSGNAERVAAMLQDRLNSLNGLALTLKHVHWNVTGPELHRRPHHAGSAGGVSTGDGR